MFAIFSFSDQGFSFPFQRLLPPPPLFFFRKQKVTPGNRTFHGFFQLWHELVRGEIHRDHRKESLNIGKTVEFERDLLKTNEDIALQLQRCENSQMFVYWGAPAPPPPPPPHHKNVANLRSYIFAPSRRVSRKFGNFTYLKAFFSVV